MWMPGKVFGKPGCDFGVLWSDFAPEVMILFFIISMYIYIYMGVSKNKGTPKSSILIGFSIINHPFWGTTIFGNTLEPK